MTTTVRPPPLSSHVVGNTPEFLCDFIPPSVGETNNYNLRNSHNISQTTNRLSISQQSFFPSTTKLWNLLDLRIRQLSIFESFKYKLKQHYYKNAKPPPSGGFRGGRAGRAPPLKFAKHML